MLKLLRKFLSIAVIVLASYVLITSRFELNGYLLLVAGCMLLVMGFEQFQQKKHGMAIALIGACIFCVFVFVQMIF